MNFSFNWVWYPLVSGQVLVIVVTYKVLTDTYQTEKTFEHMDVDCPIHRKDLQ